MITYLCELHYLTTWKLTRKFVSKSFPISHASEFKSSHFRAVARVMSSFSENMTRVILCRWRCIDQAKIVCLTDSILTAVFWVCIITLYIVRKPFPSRFRMELHSIQVRICQTIIIPTNHSHRSLSGAEMVTVVIIDTQVQILWLYNYCKCCELFSGSSIIRTYRAVRV